MVKLQPRCNRGGKELLRQIGLGVGLFLSSQFYPRQPQDQPQRRCDGLAAPRICDFDPPQQRKSSLD